MSQTLNCYCLSIFLPQSLEHCKCCLNCLNRFQPPCDRVYHLLCCDLTFTLFLSFALFQIQNYLRRRNPASRNLRRRSRRSSVFFFNSVSFSYFVQIFLSYLSTCCSQHGFVDCRIHHLHAKKTSQNRYLFLCLTANGLICLFSCLQSFLRSLQFYLPSDLLSC